MGLASISTEAVWLLDTAAIVRFSREFLTNVLATSGTEKRRTMAPAENEPLSICEDFIREVLLARGKT
jgi:hypothetical protein